jgi:low affinity Fe/Cu permease
MAPSAGSFVCVRGESHLEASDVGAARRSTIYDAANCHPSRRLFRESVGVRVARDLRGIMGFLPAATFNWCAIATLAAWFMTLVIQRAEHRDTQAIHAKLDEILMLWAMHETRSPKWTNGSRKRSRSIDDTCVRMTDLCDGAGEGLARRAWSHCEEERRERIKVVRIVAVQGVLFARHSNRHLLMGDAAGQALTEVGDPVHESSTQLRGKTEAADCRRGAMMRTTRGRGPGTPRHLPRSL